MISTLGRMMAVLTAMASAAFMTFAISRWATIPDWAAEAQQMEGFVLNRTEGENPSWSAQTRQGESVSTSTNAAEVLEAMYKKAKTDLDAEVQALQSRIPQLEQDLAATQTSIDEDLKAVDTRQADLMAQLEEQDNEINRLTDQMEREKENAHTLQMERERRRADVFRLQEQLGEVEADFFRAQSLKEQLRDLIERTKGNVAKLESRNKELQQSVN